MMIVVRLSHMKFMPQCISNWGSKTLVFVGVHFSLTDVLGRGYSFSLLTNLYFCITVLIQKMKGDVLWIGSLTMIGPSGCSSTSS